MSAIDYTSILAAGQAGTVAAERISEHAGESMQRSTSADRVRHSRLLARQAAGMDVSNNEARESSPDRDGDGRMLSTRDSDERDSDKCETGEGEADALDTDERCTAKIATGTDSPRSPDPTGRTGRLLDLMG